MLFIGCFVDSNGALGGRIICDTGYISSRSEVNVISFIVKTIYLATVMFKQIADSVSGVVFRFSDLNGMDAHELNPIIVRRGKVNNLMMFFIMENVNVVVNTNIGVLVYFI